jgi:hypothetical protein
MLGTLQDIGYEDAYLHINEPDHKLFVEITKNDAANGKYHSLFFGVTKSEVCQYLDSKISLKEMARTTTQCYKWTRKPDAQGVFRKVDKKVAVDYFDDVDMFEPEFCHQKQLILYYMNQIDALSN